MADEASKLYPLIGGTPKDNGIEWEFPSGAKINFRHLQHEKNIYDWQGAQIPRIGWDELTHFTERQFFYLLSRARSAAGIPTRVRATCNPDAGSWLAKFIDWWIDPRGLPIPERCQQTRWFVRLDDKTVWGDSRQELINRLSDTIAPENLLPKSFRFIPASLEDNPLLLNNDPAYKANLLAQSRVERERLLHGNWRVKSDQGIIKPHWLRHRYGAPPTRFDRVVQSWDTAATAKETSAFWACITVGIADNLLYLLDVYWCRHQYADGKRAALSLAQKWRPNLVLIEEASTGITLLQEWRQASSFSAHGVKPDKSKVERLEAESPAVESGKLILPEQARWLPEFESALLNFPDTQLKDPIDALSQLLKWYRIEYTQAPAWSQRMGIG
ncbi:MAG: phage terminase large subunit [Spirulinaceae cyanobacterium SM2_1_0]|nr:phage terminase large subunit [Spirulinaceae cyanobacterium SM2_1_0]